MKSSFIKYLIILHVKRDNGAKKPYIHPKIRFKK
jgi:hypothetical protein